MISFLKSYRNQMDFKIRYAVKSDAELIVNYIKQLADFENELENVEIEKEDIIKNVFLKEGAKVIIGEYEGCPVGFAIFHETFSTFLGKAGIGLVDLYVESHMRNKGFGKKMLAFLAAITMEKEYGRLEWWVHDWNLNAKKFYDNLGANMVKDIRIYRLDKDALENLSKEVEKSEHVWIS